MYRIVCRNLLFYDDIPWGADGAITNLVRKPPLFNGDKKICLICGQPLKQSGLLREKARGYLSPLLKIDVPTIAVFNTLNWQRSGLINVYIDRCGYPG